MMKMKSPWMIVIVGLIVGSCLMRATALQAATVSLAWDASVSPTVAGYEIHYGVGSGQYTIAVDTGPATTVSLDGLTSGVTYYFAALAYDGNGVESDYSNEVFTVAQDPAPVDTEPPTVTITNPVDGAVVPRNSNLTISVDASDNVAVDHVEIRINGSVLCADSSGPYSCVWHTPAPPNRRYTISATAYDAAGNQATATIEVTT